MKNKIINIVIGFLITTVAVAFISIGKSFIDTDNKGKHDDEQINHCQQLFQEITDEFNFEKLSIEKFDAARSCFSKNETLCKDFRDNIDIFNRKLYVISEFKNEFEIVKKLSKVEQELFLAKINRVMSSSGSYCYKGFCKPIGKPFICGN